jgi:hypothetical protein
MPHARILAKGCNVTLQGLISRPEINGCRGVVLSDFDSEKQRWPVCVMKYKGKKEDMLLKPCNLVLLVQTESDSGESEVSEISDESGSSSDDDAEGHESGSYFKCSYKISQNMEHPYRSYSGDPKLSFTDKFFMSQPMSSHQYCHSTACPLRAGISSTSLQHLAAAYKGTKLRSCKKCRTAWYCSHGCQQHDWLHGNHRANCTQFEHACSKMAEDAYPEIEENEEADTDPAFVRKAFRGVKQSIEGSRVCPSRRSAKHFSGITFEEKCTMEFLINCRGMQTMMSDMFYRRANSLPPSDADAVFTFPVTAYSEVEGFENVNEWVVFAGKFKSWMWRSSNEGPGLNFAESIPAHMCWPNVNVAVRNAIELLQTWEPQDIDNWAMQREATVMVNLIAGFGHQKCFVDEIMTPGALMHSYVLLLLRWAANWKGPATHVWSRMMQALLSALLSGLELSETKHSSRCNPAKVAVLEPACEKFVSILAADVSRLRFYKPTHLKTLPQLMKECSTDKERSRLLLDAENETISFYAEVAGRELRACLRARRHFPSLNLEPLGRLAAFHMNQLLCSGAYKMFRNDPLSPLDLRLYQEVLDAGVPPLIAPALLLIDQLPCTTANIASATSSLAHRLQLSPDSVIPCAEHHAQQFCHSPLP